MCRAPFPKPDSKKRFQFLSLSINSFRGSGAAAPGGFIRIWRHVRRIRKSACGARLSLQGRLAAPQAQAVLEKFSKKWKLPLFRHLKGLSELVRTAPFAFEKDSVFIFQTCPCIRLRRLPQAFSPAPSHGGRNSFHPTRADPRPRPGKPCPLRPQGPSPAQDFP